MNDGIIYDINNEKPTNISVPNATNPAIIPSSIYLGLISSPTGRLRSLIKIYQRNTSREHEENPKGETIIFVLFSQGYFEP